MRKRHYEIYYRETKETKVLTTKKANRMLVGAEIHWAANLHMGKHFWHAGKRVKCVQ